MRYMAIFVFLITSCCAVVYREYYEPEGSTFKENAEWVGFSESVGARKISVCGFEYGLYSYKPTNEVLLLFGPLIFPIIPGVLLPHKEYKFDGNFIAYISGNVQDGKLLSDSIIVKVKIGDAEYEQINGYSSDRSRNINNADRAIRNELTFHAISIVLPRNEFPDVYVQFQYNGKKCNETSEVKFEIESDISIGM